MKSFGKYLKLVFTVDRSKKKSNTDVGLRNLSDSSLDLFKSSKKWIIV